MNKSLTSLIIAIGVIAVICAIYLPGGYTLGW